MQALAELPLLAAALVCLGLAAILVLLVYALFHGLIDILNLIPKVNIGTAWLNGVKNAVWHALGVAYHGIDRLAGWQFHQLARLIGLVWREFKAHATVIAEAAATLAGLGFVVAGVRALVHHLAHGAGNVSKAVKALEKEWHGIEHRVKSLERDWTKGIGHDLRIEVAGLEKEAGKLIGKTIPAIQADVGAIPGELADARTWVSKNFVSSTAKAIEAAVAVGLTALGLSWLRCNSNPFNNNRKACGLWTDLSALLGLASTVLVAADFESLVREMGRLEADVVNGFYTVWNL